MKCAARDAARASSGKTHSCILYSGRFYVKYYILCNLALTPIADPLGALTDLLRNKTPGDYGALYAKVAEKVNELAAF